MAKRFRDSKLYDKAWYQGLPPRLKCAWDWLCDRCDEIGIVSVNMNRLSFEVGEPVTLEELERHFKVIVFDEDKLFLPSFVRFQYCDESGRLSPKNKFHLSIAKKLQALGFTTPEFKPLDALSLPSPMGIDTVSMGLGSPQGKGKGNTSSSLSVDQIAQCVEAWRETLVRFKIDKDAALDAPAIGALIQRYGFEKARLALLGAGFESKTKDYDPANHVSVTRILTRPYVLEKLVNLGAQNKPRELKVYDGGGP